MIIAHPYCKPTRTWQSTCWVKTLLRKATKRFMVTLEELQKYNAQVGNLLTAICDTCQKPDLAERKLLKRKILGKMKNVKSKKQPFLT